jgi:hypothetical protein
VDNALEVVDRYHDKILKLEREILLKPKINTVRNCKFFAHGVIFNPSSFLWIFSQVHILSGDLTLHKRTLGPIKTLVYGLRRYDKDRCIALINSQTGGDAEAKAKAVGFMSHRAKIYLVSTVHRHLGN